MVRLKRKLLIPFVLSFILVLFATHRLDQIQEVNEQNDEKSSTGQEHRAIVKINSLDRPPGKIHQIQSSLSVKSIRFIISDIFELNGMTNEHSFKVLHKPKIDKCRSSTNQPFTLLVLVVSQVDNFEYRDTVRESWANYDFIGTDSLRVVFVLGHSDEDRVNDLVEKESQKYGDILQEAFKDSFNTLKVIAGLKWASEHCKNVDFVGKVNENTAVNSITLINYLQDVNNEARILKNVMFGDVRMNTAVKRDSDDMDYISESEFKHDIYYPYCHGSAYVLTKNLVTSLYTMSTYVLWPPFSTVYDDIYIGTLALSMGAHFVQMSLYYEKYPVSNIKLWSSNTTLFVQVVNAHEIKRVWKTINSDDPRALKSIRKPYYHDKRSSTCLSGQNIKFGRVIYKFFNIDNMFILDRMFYRPNYKFVINPMINECLRDKQLLILAMVMVAADRVDRRNDIRNTWANKKLYGDDLKVVFVMGLSRNRSVDSIVREEAKRHNDILLFDLRDSYKMITTKVIMSLKWASTFCRTAFFIMRVNDDILVNVPVLASYLKIVKKNAIYYNHLRKIIIGNLYILAKIKTDEYNKYHVTKDEFSEYWFYPYAEGITLFFTLNKCSLV